LDESLSALDYKLRKQMQIELKQLQRKLGITFIFVTHDQEEALSMSDRIIVMRDGIIEQDGSPREIYEEPKNLFVARFIGEINVFNAEMQERIDDKRIKVTINDVPAIVYYDQAVVKGDKLQVLLRPEDLLIEEIKESETRGIVGHVTDRTYKGMTLESIVELDSGMRVLVSEFFNEDDPDVDHSIGQKVAITWIESWEVVLNDEQQD
ncbi:TOBE domain-containing protein, partial [Vibrio fujianensis]